MPGNRIIKPTAMLFLLGVSLFVLHGLRVDHNLLLLRGLLNFGHLPLFALIALVMLELSTDLLGSRLRTRAGHYRWAFAGTLAIGVASETLQFFGPRDADLFDLLRDALGAACALALRASWDRRMLGENRDLARVSWVVRLIAVLLVLASFAPVVLSIEAYRRRAARVPALCSFESSWEMRFVDTLYSAVVTAPAPAGWGKAASDTVGRVTFSTTRYSGIVFREPYPDWSDHECLTLDLYSELEQPVSLILRIHDAHHSQHYSDRFNRRFEISPGLTRLRIPMEQIRQAPERREMNMAGIRQMTLFAVEPPELFVIYLDDLKLGVGDECTPVANARRRSTPHRATQSPPRPDNP